MRLAQPLLQLTLLLLLLLLLLMAAVWGSRPTARAVRRVALVVCAVRRSAPPQTLQGAAAASPVAALAPRE